MDTADKTLGKNRSFPDNPFDLTEEASQRPEGEGATEIARRADADNSTEETWDGPVKNAGGFFGNNKVSTSLDEE